MYSRAIYFRKLTSFAEVVTLRRAKIRRSSPEASLALSNSRSRWPARLVNVNDPNQISLDCARIAVSELSSCRTSGFVLFCVDLYWPRKVFPWFIAARQKCPKFFRISVKICWHHGKYVTNIHYFSTYLTMYIYVYFLRWYFSEGLPWIVIFWLDLCVRWYPSQD